MILLDTHTLVWLVEGSDSLGEKALIHINEALKVNELFVSTISFWEVAMLVEKERLKIDMDIEFWRKNLLDKGLLEVPLRGSTAIRSATLENFHGDPADRIIVATAIELSAKLSTADKKILSWKNPLVRLNARK